MADTLWWVPFAPEMDSLQAEIRGNQEFRTRSNTDYSSIIPYS